MSRRKIREERGKRLSEWPTYRIQSMCEAFDEKYDSDEVMLCLKTVEKDRSILEIAMSEGNAAIAAQMTQSILDECINIIAYMDIMHEEGRFEDDWFELDAIDTEEDMGKRRVRAQELLDWPAALQEELVDDFLDEYNSTDVSECQREIRKLRRAKGKTNYADQSAEDATDLDNQLLDCMIALLEFMDKEEEEYETEFKTARDALAEDNPGAAGLKAVQAAIAFQKTNHD
jgi:hypothetical protein